MKQLYFLIVFAIILTSKAFAQVGINADNSQPDPSAMLDVKATNCGLLIPRISTSVRDMIPSPAIGLLIYNSTTNQFNYYNGTYWYLIETIFLTATIGTLSPGGGVSINTSNNVLPDSSAMLDVNNPTRGVLIPRTTPNLITSPTAGLMIYNTSSNNLNYYNGSQWVALCSVSTGISGAGGSQNSVGVSVSTDISGPHHSAILDVSATNKGFLIPRLTNAQQETILPAMGLVIYNTSSNNIVYYNGVCWNDLKTNILTSPIAGIHNSSYNQIIWNWNNVANATGYKWNTTNDYANATDIGNATTNTETGLTCNTLYTRYVWAYNDCGYSELTTMTQMTSDCSPTCGQPFTDSRDNKVYSTVLIGSQCWMAQNLNIGANINGINEQINNGVIEKYCYNNDESNCAIYGGLYQWNEMMQWVTTPGVKGICPTGWHLPTDGEWTTLTTFLGGESVAGGKMKSTGTIEAGTGLWLSPNTGATNESGFTGVPGGQTYVDDGAFYWVGYDGYWWSSTEISPGNAWYRYLYHDHGYTYPANYSKGDGFSVRCVLDF